MTRKILFTLLAGLALLFAFKQSARAEKYHFRNYSVDDGLPYPVVTEIFQDRDGYMWFATLGGGVSKFDGKKFTNFSTRDGLHENNIGLIFQDSEGILWFVAHNTDAIMYDGEKWMDPEKEKGVSLPSGWYIMQDSKGRYWTASMDLGLAVVEGDSLRYFYNEKTGAGIFATGVREEKGVTSGLKMFSVKKYLDMTERNGQLSRTIVLEYSRTAGGISGSADMGR